MKVCQKYFHQLFAVAVFTVVLIFLKAPVTNLLNVHLTHRSCAVPPFWSRGFARSCCDVYPTTFGKHSGGFFEAGSSSDLSYFLKRQPKSGDVVYVATADFPTFLEFFSRLGEDVRITLITGGEDIGAPWEIFHPDRDFFDYKMSALWPKGQRMTMREFISDQRLLRWHTQNYDLIGNTSYSRSDVSALTDQKIISKVHPIPIGLDFHTMAEKNGRLSRQQALDSVCSQQERLTEALSQSLPFLSRASAVYAKFDCAFLKNKRMREISRGEICRLLASYNSLGNDSGNCTNTVLFTDPLHKNPVGKAEAKVPFQASRYSYWSQVAKVKFAIAPPGMGTDTHRVWEILNLHCVAIVLSSPLDGLYGMFPVVIVQKWQEVFEEGALARFENGIVSRFGENPFNSRVKRMLESSYWVEMIRNTSRLDMQRRATEDALHDSMSRTLIRC